MLRLGAAHCEWSPVSRAGDNQPDAVAGRGTTWAQY
jgi:hypothetical protein